MKANNISVGVVSIDITELVTVNTVGKRVLYTVVFPVQLVVNVPLIAPSVLVSLVLFRDLDVKVLVHMTRSIGPAHDPRSHYDTAP